MKTKLFLFAALLMFGLQANAQNFPSVTLETEKGVSFNTADLVDGKTPFVVSFWSITCKPCIMELDAISEQFMDWSEEVDFRVVAVSTDDARGITRAKSLAQGRGWTDFTLLFDTNQDFKRALNVIVTPQIFVFDKDGNMIYKHTGYSPGGEAEVLDVLLENAEN